MLKPFQTPSCIRIPQMEVAMFNSRENLVGTDEPATIRTERDTRESTCPTCFNRFQMLSCGGIPQMDYTTKERFSSASECAAIRTERDALDNLRISKYILHSERSQVLSCGGIPQTDCTALTATGEYATIWVERDTIDRRPVPCECVSSVVLWWHSTDGLYRPDCHWRVCCHLD